MTDPILTIQDLCDETGLPRRTIHFYIQQELLPPAQGSGLGAYYQREHLVRLKLIPVLRQQGLRLDDIRQRFIELSAAELESLLVKAENTAVSTAKIAEKATSQPSAPTPYQAYTLPYGLILLVPQPLPARIQNRFSSLLKSIQAEMQDQA